MLHQHPSRQPGSPFQLQLPAPPGTTADGRKKFVVSLPAKTPYRKRMRLRVLQMIMPAKDSLSSQEMAAGQLKEKQHTGPARGPMPETC